MKKIRVGIVGANAGRGWAATAHIPALKALPQFEIAGVATTHQASAEAAAKQFSIPLAFGDAQALARHPDIDVVAVTVKVPGHYDAVMAALDAKKHVYCEWPLGLDSMQAAKMHERARQQGVRHLVGLQARAQPAVRYLRDLLAQGYVGEVLSCTMIITSKQWGPTTDRFSAYLFDSANGATLLTIPGGHSMDALCYCLGEFRELAAVVATRRGEVLETDSGTKLAKSAPDQVSVSGVLRSGAIVSIHARGGAQHGTPFLFEIQGSDGMLSLRTNTSVQYGQLELQGAQGAAALQSLPVPAQYTRAAADMKPGPAFSVAQMYAGLVAALGEGKPAEPGFDAAVVRHRMIEAIRESSDSAGRVVLPQD